MGFLNAGYPPSSGKGGATSVWDRRVGSTDLNVKQAVIIGAFVILFALVLGASALVLCCRCCGCGVFKPAKHPLEQPRNKHRREGGGMRLFITIPPHHAAFPRHCRLPSDHAIAPARCAVVLEQDSERLSNASSAGGDRHSAGSVGSSRCKRAAHVPGPGSEAAAARQPAGGARKGSTGGGTAASSSVISDVYDNDAFEEEYSEAMLYELATRRVALAARSDLLPSAMAQAGAQRPATPTHVVFAPAHPPLPPLSPKFPACPAPSPGTYDYAYASGSGSVTGASGGTGGGASTGGHAAGGTCCGAGGSTGGSASARGSTGGPFAGPGGALAAESSLEQARAAFFGGGGKKPAAGGQGSGQKSPRAAAACLRPHVSVSTASTSTVSSVNSQLSLPSDQASKRAVVEGEGPDAGPAAGAAAGAGAAQGMGEAQQARDGRAMAPGALGAEASGVEPLVVEVIVPVVSLRQFWRKPVD
ncbi:hypothetical protein HYH03_003529 [Edaphochlamys debaryana]|uniref:Uncharacterized protein n=1 Tax=Edaphochlamys debaryana TaxID=47281 RepID=A0A836C3H2_9CHLO|nr:hypothetical protein HYH03_003529 [Edaphochlamys debaryana]|eukprot:KAG2498790.1 hypothetical protein HYH03_003529 [Edaphochlamys debaryana]